MLNKIQYQVDIDRLVADTYKILSSYSFNRQNQICFQNTKFVGNIKQNVFIVITRDGSVVQWGR